MNMRSAFLATIGIGILGLATSLNAATYYVANGQSIQEAIDVAANGDKIIVRDGTFDGALNMRGKAIELRSENGAEFTTLTYTGSGKSILTCDTDETNATIIDGFTFAGGTGASAGYQTIAGGMNISGAHPTVRNCFFRDNTAGGGGAIALFASSPQFLNCTFEDNSATTTGDTGGGGAALIHLGTPRFANCIFQSNSTTGSSRGGAVRMFGGYSIFANCLFVNNEGYVGGAVDNESGDPKFFNCTFAYNEARAYAAALHGRNSNALFQIRNSIIWGNEDPYGYDLYGTGGAEFDIAFSNMDFEWAGQGNISVEPMFKAAGANDFRLAEGSPCIDRGDALALPNDFGDLDNDGDTSEPIPMDKDFALRTTGSQVDMGAYEIQLPDDEEPGCPTDANGDGTTDLFDLVLLLDNWGVCDGCGGDADGNGLINLFDLQLMLDEWGPCQP